MLRLLTRAFHLIQLVLRLIGKHGLKFGNQQVLQGFLHDHRHVQYRQQHLLELNASQSLLVKVAFLIVKLNTR